MKILYILLFVLLLLSCSDNNKTVSNTKAVRTSKGKIETINLDLLSPQKLKYSELFSEYKLIPLETSKDCLIARIDQLEIYQNEYYIFDKNAGNIFVFDEQGYFVRRIGKKGKGKGEYIKPKCFSINKNNGLLACLDSKLKKIIIYDADGEVVREIKLKHTHLYCNIILTDKYIYYDTHLTKERPQTKSVFYAIDFGGNVKWEWSPNQEDICILKTPSDHSSNSLILSDDGLILRRWFMNSVYKLENSTLKPYISFMAKNSLSLSEVKEISKDELKLKKHRRDFSMFKGVDKYFETKENLYISFTYGKIMHLLIEKDSNKVLSFIPGENDLLGTTTTNFRFFEKDYLITSTDDRLMSQLIKNDRIKKELNLSVSSNPVLIKYKLNKTLPYNEN